MGSCLSSLAENSALKKIQAMINDPKALEKPLDMAFKYFDKDKSGFIEGSEVMAVTEKVCRLAGMQKAPVPAINVVFDKVAGADGRLDRAEFQTLLQKMFKIAEEQLTSKVKGTPAPDATAAA